MLSSVCGELFFGGWLLLIWIYFDNDLSLMKTYIPLIRGFKHHRKSSKNPPVTKKRFSEIANLLLFFYDIPTRATPSCHPRTHSFQNQTYAEYYILKFPHRFGFLTANTITISQKQPQKHSNTAHTNIEFPKHSTNRTEAP